MTTDTFDFNFDERALEGRVVLVAGGTGGLGSATVAMLARDGATVVAGYLNGRERAEALKRAVEARYKATVHLVEGDISDPEVRARYVETADALGKGLYAMVCFTGDPARVKFEDASDADLHASMQENYVAPVLLAREAGLSIRARGTEGAIVLLSTMQAVAVFESSINYASPKTALIQAARIMAKQWGGPRGIRVNVIAPGVNRAGMAVKSIESGKYDFYIEREIIPRFGRPEDVARVARLLVEPDGYITGQVIAVDGGLTLRRDRG
ncbi:MAG TPA: SDR family oxidoreductase [Blastocatellia bacterium]|jgi:NAD(P)-dependent dehydrogenase (short-subunit alcohol dehydrogenase family)|nr:SDR family oxidoreductase [Blastocatellia bacterium]